MPERHDPSSLPGQALARQGAAGSIEAAGGVPPLAKLLQGGPVSAGTLAAVLCVAELVADSRCERIVTRDNR